MYRYLSAGNFSNITPRYWLGAMHSCTHITNQTYLSDSFANSVVPSSRYPPRLRHTLRVPRQSDRARVGDQLPHGRYVTSFHVCHITWNCTDQTCKVSGTRWPHSLQMSRRTVSATLGRSTARAKIWCYLATRLVRR